MERDAAPLGNLLAGLGDSNAEPDRDEILSRFLQYVASLSMELYPAQEEAILELLAFRHVILNTPTGSGKSLVALALHFQAMAEGRVSFYTAPTKALVNEKFFALCAAFGPKNVGMLTGDASVNPGAAIICCTMEILSNRALREDNLDVDYVVMDEFHFYGDKERGVAWQIPLITMKDTLFLLMSATLGDTSEIERQLFQFSGRKVAVIAGDERPVPLEFEYRETPLHATVEDLIRADEAPIYLVNFTQRDCADQAQNLTSINVCTKEDKQAITKELREEKFDSPYGKEFWRFMRSGIGIHHGGLLPKYRRVVERLAQTGLIKIISGTDTLGVGVNIPIRTVLIRQLYKFDGEKTRILSARQFHQISGRAGRKGFDDHGRVIVQAPEWTIENKRIKAKIAANPNLKKKLVLKKPPPRSIPWDRARFEKLRTSPPEPLVPQFNVTHGMMIHLLQSDPDIPGGGYRRLISLIERSHTTDRDKKFQRRRAATLFRTLVDTDIVRIESGEHHGVVVRVKDDLQYDFSLNHTLSLWLIETLALLDPDSPTLALDMLTLVEAILENPRAILYKQVNKLKGELVARLKAEGVEYQDRMARLEQVTHPKPNEEFIYESFNAFAQVHPWVGDENIRPKSIAREMVEGLMSFNDYIRQYGLARSEGLLLRHISQVYKTSVQNVPESRWTEDFEDILAYLHGLVLRTDSSLLDEWQLLVAGPEAAPKADRRETPEVKRDISSNPRAFRARVRNELQILLKALADRDYQRACTLVRQTDHIEWTPKLFEQQLTPYFEEHTAIDITPRARQANNTILFEDKPRLWNARQRIFDPEGDTDWSIYAILDLREAIDESGPLIELDRIGT
jgi:superfamily II DNA/RNA helicase